VQLNLLKYWFDLVTIKLTISGEFQTTLNL